MRVLITGWSIALVACSFHGNGSQPIDAAPPAGGSDARVADGPLPIDAPPIDATVVPADAPLGTVCYGHAMVHVCVAAAPSAADTLADENLSIDTSDAANCDFTATQSDGSELCVILRSQIVYSSILGAFGSRPLVIISDGDFTISGTIDASSGVGDDGSAGQLGPGADPASCATSGATGYAGASGVAGSGAGAGGGGGSFLTGGGRGGSGAIAGATGGSDGALLPAPSVLHGGCRGGNGGDGNAASVPGEGGAGGGAVYLIATGTLELSGVINASGAAGTGGRAAGIDNRPGAGGGGGGAGGMIVLEGSAVNASPALLFANGGGGGEGAGDTADGVDGTTTDDSGSTPDGGNGGTGFGGDGGAGASPGMTARDGAPGTTYGGGGGGGGGSGYTAKIHP